LNAEDVPEVLDAHCRRQLAGYKRPRTYRVVDELPREPSGKLSRQALREPYWQDREPDWQDVACSPTPGPTRPGDPTRSSRGAAGTRRSPGSRSRNCGATAKAAARRYAGAAGTGR